MVDYALIMDIRHWHVVIDWTHLAVTSMPGGLQVAGAIIQASGAQPNPLWAQHVRDAQSVGLPIGARHILAPTDIIGQAQRFATLVSSAALPLGCWLDITEKDVLSRHVDAFLYEIAKVAPALSVGIYAKHTNWSDVSPRSSIQRRQQVWLADYTATVPNSVANVPRLAASWTAWAIWHFTCFGKVAGCAELVDLHWANVALFPALAQHQAILPPPVARIPTWQDFFNAAAYVARQNNIRPYIIWRLSISSAKIDTSVRAAPYDGIRPAQMLTLPPAARAQLGHVMQHYNSETLRKLAKGETPPADPAPIPYLGNSRFKLGAHMITDSPSESVLLALQLVQRGATVLKLLDQMLALASTAKAVNPHLAVIGRIYTPLQPVDNWQHSNPTAAARAWVESQLAQITAYPAVDYWEGPNEPNIGNRAALQWYAAFERERVMLMAQYGLRCCVGNFSTGTPDLPDYGLFAPAIDAIRQQRGVLGLHEYGWPSMLSGASWHCLRYRRFIAAVGAVPVVISECGRDPQNVSIQPQHADWAGDYVSDLLWYERELQQDPYVIGAAMFTWGSYADTPWRYFDLVANPNWGRALLARLGK